MSELLALPALLVRPVLLAVLLVRPVPKALPELQVFKVLPVLRVRQDLSEQPALAAFPVLRVLLVLLDLRGILAGRPVRRAFRGRAALLVLLG